ncbi:cytochrome c biogenesis heme-transporting ATPase CcmA [Pasteurellaceae bacterium HPA106]|uniref:cytochrome c biogenesis heme-transporting ATPase CcmA n=1 Tax=Spirabiliibacterium pneumoniae TaxID=221400 RepID=UPI001AAD1D8A|nr:cytochrome c biogenesis heme-transporting ATPase CcmA [Spirabiliibacterium pneumoniae]MBE2897187.1 cytochrome c biogenesis heme-transporting ATPase CcmA [Spirabiliibacterium pneumoniae]
MFAQHQLTLHQLACQRGDNTLFAGLSLAVQSGEMVQLVGHNGIGKTSLLRIIAGLSQPLQGRVLFDGTPIGQQRESYLTHLLYIGHHAGLKMQLSPWDNLRFYQRVSPCVQAESAVLDALYRVGLMGLEDTALFQLSAGQQKRVALARLYLSQAPIWLLDEPFTAIDTQGQLDLTALFEQHCQRGGIVMLTSHQAVNSPLLKRLDLSEFQCEEAL